LLLLATFALLALLPIGSASAASLHPSLTITSPTLGYIGGTVTLSGAKFAGSSAITFSISGGAIVTQSVCATTTKGSFTACTFAVPPDTAGPHTVTATDAHSDSGSATFTVIPSLKIISTANGNVGGTVTLSGSGYAGTSAVTFYFDLSKAAGSPCATLSSGSFTGCTFVIPPSRAGLHLVTGVDTHLNVAFMIFSVFPHLAITSSPVGTVGSTVTLSGSGYASTSAITFALAGGTIVTQSACNTNGQGSFTGCTFVVPSDSPGPHSVTAKDSHGNLNNNLVTFTVILPLVPGAVTPSSPSIDSGQSITLAANPSNGEPPYSYHWYSSASNGGACSSGTALGTSSTQSVSPIASAYYCYVVTDSISETASSGWNLVTVDANPTVAVTPGGPLNYDVGQTATGLTATVTYSGVNTALVEWYSSANAACSASSTDTLVSGASITPGTASVGTTYYCAVVFDSGVPGYSYASNAVEVIVTADPTVGVSPSGPFSYDVGQTATGLTAAVTYTGPNTASVEWYSSTSSSCSATSTDTGSSGNSFTPGTLSAGTTYYCAAVSDSGIPGYSSASNGVEVTLYTDPSAGTPTSSVVSVDYGQTVTITAHPSGGTGTYTGYSWSGLPFGCTGTTTATSSCTPTSGANTYSITYTVTDSNGQTSTSSPTLFFSVYTSVAASPSATVNPVGVDEATEISAGASGGTGSYGYAWSGLPSGCGSPGNVASFSCTPATGDDASSPYTVQVTVTDTNGGTATTSFMLTVNPALAASPSATVNPVTVGSSTTISANAAGGSGTYSTYAWSGLPSGCGTPGNVASFSCTPATGDDTSSPYTVQVKVTDSDGATVTNSFSLTVVAASSGGGGGGGGGGGCVAYGTPILTPTGYVLVQDLHPGDAVMEYNFTSHSLMVGEFISGNTTNVSELIDVNNGQLYLTPTDQPIYIQNSTFTGWLHNPQNLTTADSIFDPMTNSWVHVFNVQLVQENTTVYDVITSGFNNFVANGFLLDVKTS
jgi:large repetitive protein